MSQVEMLFDEFAARHARGERPDAREYLERAGESRDDLARLLDGFLAAAPVQPPGEETVALFESLLGESPPLLAERVRRGWRREEIVEWIRERFGIPEEKREKVASLLAPARDGAAADERRVGGASGGATGAFRAGG